jgi:hypothetical protein
MDQQGRKNIVDASLLEVTQWLGQIIKFSRGKNPTLQPCKLGFTCNGYSVLYNSIIYNNCHDNNTNSPNPAIKYC